MATKTITTELIRESRTFGTSGCQNTGNEVKAGAHVMAYVPEKNAYMEICRKCGGSGFLPEYSGWCGGSCFACGGPGLIFHRDGTIKSLVQLLNRRVTDQARRTRQREAEWAAKKAEAGVWKAANPEVAKIIDEVCGEYHASNYGVTEYGQTRDGLILQELCLKASREIPTGKQAGFIVSLYTEFHARKAKKETGAAARQWLGTVGQTIDITGTVIYINRFEGKFGWSTLYLIKDETGNTAKWYRKGWCKGEKGDTVIVTGIIKELTESEDHGKLTVITRGTLHNPPN